MYTSTEQVPAWTKELRQLETMYVPNHCVDQKLNA